MAVCTVASLLFPLHLLPNSFINLLRLGKQKWLKQKMAVLCGEWLSNLVVPRPATATDFSRTSPLFLPEQEGRLSSLAVKAVSSGETSKILVRDAFVSANQKENISIYPEELFKANRYIIFCSFTLLNQSASTYC